MECPFGILFIAFGNVNPNKMNRNGRVLNMLSEVLRGGQPGFFLEAGIENRF